MQKLHADITVEYFQINSRINLLRTSLSIVDEGFISFRKEIMTQLSLTVKSCEKKVLLILSIFEKQLVKTSSYDKMMTYASQILERKEKRRNEDIILRKTALLIQTNLVLIQTNVDLCEKKKHKKHPMIYLFQFLYGIFSDF